MSEYSDHQQTKARAQCENAMRIEHDANAEYKRLAEATREAKLRADEAHDLASGALRELRRAYGDASV